MSTSEPTEPDYRPLTPEESRSFDSGELPAAVEESAARQRRRVSLETSHRVRIEPSIGDRRNRFPWGLSALCLALLGLAAWGIYFAVVRLVAL